MCTAPHVCVCVCVRRILVILIISAFYPSLIPTLKDKVYKFIQLHLPSALFIHLGETNKSLDGNKLVGFENAFFRDYAAGDEFGWSDVESWIPAIDAGSGRADGTRVGHF